MPSATDRLEFAPPHAQGSLRALALAVLVHILLIAALTWGVNWKRSDEAASFVAELWSSLPQQAAPKLADVSPPLPVPVPAPVPTPAPPPPPPPPPVKAPEVRVAPPEPDADIALEQDKKRKLQQQLKQAEAQKAEKLLEKREAELQAKKEKELEKKKEKELKAREVLAERKALEEARKAEAKKQDAKDLEKQKQAAASEKARQANINRMMGQAGATGAADAKGSAQKSSGPRGNSTTYGAIVRAAIKPNVVFTDEIVGNPMATIEVRLTLDGTVISQRLIEPSGNKAWEEAAIKAIIRTAVMPRDIDGRIPDTTLILEMKPKN